MFEGLLGTPKEQRTQLFFRDDGKFVFRKLPFEDACLVEKVGGEIIKAWKHFYSTQIPFNGFKNIHADMVTLAHDRDIILDPFNKIPDIDKPEKSQNGILGWIANIGEIQRYKQQNKPQSTLLIDKITYFLGAGLIIMMLAFGIRAAVG